MLLLFSLLHLPPSPTPSLSSFPFLPPTFPSPFPIPLPPPLYSENINSQLPGCTLKGWDFWNQKSENLAAARSGYAENEDQRRISLDCACSLILVSVTNQQCLYNPLEPTNFLTKAEFFLTDPSSLFRVSSPGRSAHRSGRPGLVKQSILKQVRSVTCNLEVLLPKLQLCTGFGQRLTANFFSLFLQIFFVRFESMSSSRLSCLIYCDLYFWTYLFFLSSFQLLFINFLLLLLSLTLQNQNR